jgi:hypothetical protein
MARRGQMEMETGKRGRQRFRGLFIGESIAILASVVIAYISHWRMPVSPWIAVPAGTTLWACGFVYTLHLRKGFREAAEGRRKPATRRRGYPLVEARGAMHLGVALGFRSWPTLIVAVACLAVNLLLVVYMRRKLRKRMGMSNRR